MITILLFTIPVSLCVAAISIQTTEQYILMDGSTGRDVTLVCSVDPLVDVVTWKSSLFPEDLTNCDYQTNVCVPDTSRGFTFTADYVNKSYYMTITQMTWEDNAIYTCRQGNGVSQAESFEIEGVLLVDPPTITDNWLTQTIEVTTGCIYPESQVILTWYIQKADNSTTKYIPSNNISTYNSIGCDGEAKYIQNSFTLLAPTSNSKIAVHFFVEVEHLLVGTTWRSDLTQHTYLIEAKGKNNKTTNFTETKNTDVYYFFTFVITLPGGVIALVVIKKKKNSNTEKDCLDKELTKVITDNAMQDNELPTGNTDKDIQAIELTTGNKDNEMQDKEVTSVNTASDMMDNECTIVNTADGMLNIELGTMATDSARLGTEDLTTMKTNL